MAKRTPMGNGMSRHIILSSRDRGNSSPGNRGTPEPNHHGDSGGNRGSSRYQFHYRSGYGATALPTWYHIGTAIIAIAIIAIAIILGIIGA